MYVGSVEAGDKHRRAVHAQAAQDILLHLQLQTSSSSECMVHL
jgi:hypothetical protein